MTLADILQIQQVRSETQQREQSVPGLLTSDQLAQVAAIETLLAEIGENVVVILSTHIVDDVSDLCANMAIMGEGEILLTGTPSDVLDKLKNKLWRTKIKRGDIATYRDQHQVILSHLSAGQTIIHVLSDDSPGQEFEPIDADLEDVYFSTLLSNGINVSF